MAKVTIETRELTLSKVDTDDGYAELWHVVQLIDKLVRAMDAAHPAAGKYYHVRTHLIAALERDE